MAIVTILGTIGVPREGVEKALYRFDEKLPFRLKKERYTNMLPLLMENFDTKVIPVYTEKAKAVQQEVLEEAFGDLHEALFDARYLVKDVDEEGFAHTFKIINDAIAEEGVDMIDLSHGFRHLPILATIALIVSNIEQIDKIRHIFFAKEIDKGKRYEIIDLKNYLELANISYLLSTFNQNYTVSGNIRFTNPLYAQVAQELKKFSEHFLSNSLKTLIEERLIDDILKSLEQLQREQEIANLNNYIKYIRLHLTRIKGLCGESREYIKFYKVAKMMDERGYQLNAITLLFEAIGYYCLDVIERHTHKASAHIRDFRKMVEAGRQPTHIYSDYTLTNQSRNIVKLMYAFHGDYLFNPQTIGWTNEEIRSAKKEKRVPKKESRAIKGEIFDYLKKIPQARYRKFKKYIVRMESLRNNLTHGNSSEAVADVEREFAKNLKLFEEMVIEEDILGV